MPLLIQMNLFFLFLFGTVFFLPPETTTILRIAHSFIELLFIVVLPGINLAFLFQYFFKKKFSLLEFINIAILSSLFLVPFFLTLEYTKFKVLFPLLPFVNALFIAAIVLGIFLFHKKRDADRDIFDSPLHWKSLQDIFFSKNFLFLFILYSAIVLSIVTAYYPLPDLDPYYWMGEYGTQVQTGVITLLSGYRPLFSSLTYIFTQGASIDFYAFFKYVLPSFLLLLIFPVTLLAEKFPRPLHKMIIFLLPFASGITVIYLTLPIPQSIISIGIFFFFSFLLYSFLAKDSFFYFLGGGILSFSFFYHEAITIPLATWLLFSLFYYRREVFQLIMENKLTTLLLLVVLFPALHSPLFFIASRIRLLISSLLDMHPNFLFPQYYVNVDGSQMGWGDFTGVIKYYLFYIGPALMLTLGAFLYSLCNKSIRPMILSKEGKVMTSIFFVFFVIAEILPRLTGIALLPDRAWVFSGTIALFFLVALFLTSLGKNKLFLWLIILGFYANISAALYINTLKKYVITDRQLTSATWIEKNLPSNRIIFTLENGNLLSFFSKSQVITIDDPNFLFNEQVFEKDFESQKDPFSVTDQKKAIEMLQNIVNNLDIKNVDRSINELQDALSQIALIEKMKKENTPDDFKSYYVYYAAPDDKSPYFNRPYMRTIKNNEKEMIFNQRTDLFEKVYSDEKNHIYLWKIL